MTVWVGELQAIQRLYTVSVINNWVKFFDVERMQLKTINKYSNTVKSEQ